MEVTDIGEARNGQRESTTALMDIENSQSEWLFVYGTLKASFGNYRAIESEVISKHSSRTQGILVNLGPFPAMIPGEGWVEGKLLKVHSNVIKITDQIEGYRGKKEASLYHREMVTCHLDDGTCVDAWTYFYAKPGQLEDRPRCEVGELDRLPLFRWPVKGELTEPEF